MVLRLCINDTFYNFLLLIFVKKYRGIFFLLTKYLYVNFIAPIKANYGNNFY